MALTVGARQADPQAAMSRQEDLEPRLGRASQLCIQQGPVPSAASGSHTG